MLSLKNLGYFGLVVVAILSLGRQSSAQTMSCSSDDGNRHYCPAETRGGVQLLKQRSDSPCEQGRSWVLIVVAFGSTKGAEPIFWWPTNAFVRRRMHRED